MIHTLKPHQNPILDTTVLQGVPKRIIWQQRCRVYVNFMTVRAQMQSDVGFINSVTVSRANAVHSQQATPPCFRTCTKAYITLSFRRNVFSSHSF